MAGGKINGAPQLTWVNVISTLALLGTVFAGAWVLFQSQFAGLEARTSVAEATLSSDIKENRIEIGKVRDENIGRREHNELLKRLDERFDYVTRKLDEGANRVQTQTVHDSINKQLDEIRERLRYLERDKKDLEVKVK